MVWGEYHQSFTAWAMWAREPVSVEAADMETLTAAIRTEEVRRGREHIRFPPAHERLGPANGSPPPGRCGPGAEQRRPGAHPLGSRGGLLRAATIVLARDMRAASPQERKRPMTAQIIHSPPDDRLNVVTHSPDGESRGLIFRVGDVFPMDPFKHLMHSVATPGTDARPWGLSFLRVPQPRAGKHEGPTSTTSGGDGTGPEETTAD